MGLGINGYTLRYQSDNPLADHVFYSAIDANNSKELMRIKGNGNVAIGITNSNAPLQFANTLVNRKIVLWETANNDNQYSRFGVNGNSVRYQSDNPLADHVFYSAIDANNSKELMRIKGNGNVGIGITNSNAPLQFANTLVNRKIVLWETANNDNQYSGFGLNGNSVRYQSDNPSADHVFYSAIDANNSKELLRIKGNGNLGIGTSNPSSKLSISTTGSELPGTALVAPFRINAGTLGYNTGNELNLASFGFFSGNNSALGIKAYRVTGGPSWVQSGIILENDVDNTPRAGNAFIALAGSGNIGIGTTASAAKLDVNGFSKLGELSPNIKMKLITGTMPDGQGKSILIDLGIPIEKVLSVNILAKTNISYPPNYTSLPGVEYTYFLLNTSLVLETSLLNSAYLISEPFRDIITYME